MDQYKRISKILLILQGGFFLLTILTISGGLLSAHPAPGKEEEPTEAILLYAIPVIFLLTGSALAFLSKSRLLFYMHLVIGFLPLMLFLSFIVFGESFL